MAKMVLKDAFLSVGGTDLSDHVKQITINYSAEVQETTAMGDSSKTRIAGLKDFSIDVDMQQDFAAGKVDATLFPLVGTSSALVIRPSSAVVGTSNPEFTGNGVLESYPPIGNSVGEVMETSVTFQGDGDLSRATS